ncbi:hypothetical protein [Shinella sp. G-2]|uniref:hypothetical protein n=1 Tax=Shinella sp. G-2 TaxID=3133141 RepID=UPI003D0734AE
MRKLLKLSVSGTTPIQHGMDHMWSVILDLTRETDVFLYSDVTGRYDQAHRTRVANDLAKLVACGFLERLQEKASPRGARPYRLLQRQSETPVLRDDGKGRSTVGQGLQNMWNVMRRARGGFTVNDLAIEASTDDCVVKYDNANSYCRALERAGILKKMKAGKGSTGRALYVLLGSANTGPKPPRRYKASFILDENQNRIIGPAEAEEIAP